MPIEQELMSSSPAQDGRAGMPGSLGFRHALHDAAVFQHDVMRRTSVPAVHSRASAPSTSGMPV